MKVVRLPGLRPGLTGLAVLLTAASGMAAGVTTVGLLVRTGFAAAGFWALGGLVERVCAQPIRQARPAVTAAGHTGRTLDVTLPAVHPDGDGAGSPAGATGRG